MIAIATGQIFQTAYREETSNDILELPEKTTSG